MHLFPQLSRVLKLTRVQEVAFGLALLNSVTQETRSFAAQYLKQKLPNLINSYINQGKFMRSSKTGDDENLSKLVIFCGKYIPKYMTSIKNDSSYVPNCERGKNLIYNFNVISRRKHPNRRRLTGHCNRSSSFDTISFSTRKRIAWHKPGPKRNFLSKIAER